MVGPAADQITIVHFNDVYNVEDPFKGKEGGEEGASSPGADSAGPGAARFSAAVKTIDHLSPMVLFSGDCFAPSFSEIKARALRTTNDLSLQ